MTYPLLDAFLTMLWFFLLVLWIFVLARVLMDVFRSRDMGGWAKAGWTVFVVVLPLVGVLAYLIARGRSMGERELEHAEAQEEQFRAYVRQAAHENGDGTAGQLAKLAELRQQGAISDAEFQQGKEKVLAGSTR